MTMLNREPDGHLVPLCKRCIKIAREEVKSGHCKLYEMHEHTRKLMLARRRHPFRKKKPKMIKATLTELWFGPSVSSLPPAMRGHGASDGFRSLSE
jgi:hypothetical protein